MMTATAPHLHPQPQSLPEPHLDDDWPTLDELSLRYLHRVMDRTKGNKTKAAEILGIDRRTVIRILAKVRKGKTPVLQTNGG
jgi:transcriptional regulator with PAS, ATPase and Fis domain